MFSCPMPTKTQNTTVAGLLQDICTHTIQPAAQCQKESLHDTSYRLAVSSCSWQSQHHQDPGPPCLSRLQMARRRGAKTGSLGEIIPNLAAIANAKISRQARLGMLAHAMMAKWKGCHLQNQQQQCNPRGGDQGRVQREDGTASKKAFIRQ